MVVVALASALPVAAGAQVLLEESKAAYAEVGRTTVRAPVAVVGMVRCAPDASASWHREGPMYALVEAQPDCLGLRRYVYVTAPGAPDPRGDASLAPTGLVVPFTDPNGLRWRVVEYAYGGARAGEGGPHRAFVSEAGPRAFDATAGAAYNFVSFVDVGLAEPQGANTVDAVAYLGVRPPAY